jgi:hypothetical protein
MGQLFPHQLPALMLTLENGNRLSRYKFERRDNA